MELSSSAKAGLKVAWLGRQAPPVLGIVTTAVDYSRTSPSSQAFAPTPRIADFGSMVIEMEMGFVIAHGVDAAHGSTLASADMLGTVFSHAVLCLELPDIIRDEAGWSNISDDHMTTEAMNCFARGFACDHSSPIAIDELLRQHHRGVDKAVSNGTWSLLENGRVVSEGISPIDHGDLVDAAFES